MRRQRRILLVLHLAIALTIGTFVYAPTYVGEPLRPLLRFILIPLAGLSGLLLFRPRWAPWARRRVAEPSRAH